jgi:hypothetical protein
MTQSAVALFEAGGTVPRLPVLGRIARALDAELTVRGRAEAARGVTLGAWSHRLASVTKRCQIEQFPHAVFPTTFAELVAVTGGEPADVE